MSQEKEEYRNQAEDRDSTINQMLKTFNKIQENLNEIKEREGVLVISNPEDEANSIVRDIEAINQLMKENEALNQELNRKIRNSDLKMAEFRRMIANLNRQIEIKNKEIAELNLILQGKDAKIGELYFSLDSMNTQVAQRDQKIESTIDDLNTAYYTYGTFDELEEKKIVTKEGGFLGLGKTESLLDNMNMDYFTKIDIRKQKSFLIYAKEAELLSKHPKSSYEFRGEDKVDSLVITDTEAFWKNSKLMVVLID
ncbi:MAG: hypothetical protein CMP59_12735 [Flavobacteriales bacterium]|nr:hypothetical protein [Flavobacteriales bacterium]